MKRYILVLIVMLLFAQIDTSAQTLPPSPWYTVVYQPQTDMLHWVNANGQQASMARPAMLDEAQFLDLRMSPNGQTMVMVSELNTGVQALGIYDFSISAFVQVHQAQPGETVSLGGENIFTANSQYFAVGFFSGDFVSPAWRVILFEAATGNLTAFVDHTHPDAPDVQLSAPAVQYVDGSYVHFQLIPQATGGWHTWPAYAWRAFGFDPAVPAITESPYTRANIQLQLLTGRASMAYMDEGFAAAPQDGQTPNFNAVGWNIPANGSSMTAVHADATRYHLSARWANGGEWILFLSTDAAGNRYWNIVMANGTPGNNSHMPFDPQFTHAYGTSDGYLVRNNAHMLLYTNGFSPNTAMPLMQMNADDRIVYVTPIGVSFTLDGLSGLVASPPVLVNTATATPEPTTPVDCSAAPGQRVTIGDQARVVTSMNGLNLRQEPNGTIITTLTGGTVFNIIGGALCDEGLYWWQVDQNGTIGWLAEASSNGYFIEPYDGPVAPPAPAVPAGCEQALASRLSVGSTATVITQLRPHNGPNGEIVGQGFYLEGTLVTVNAGPECSGGQYWWLITGQAKIGRIGQRFETVQGWVAETGIGSYNLSP